jgi:hypothetical protein
VDSYLLRRLIQPPAPPHFPAIRLMCLNYIRPRCTYAMAFWETKPEQLRAMQAAFVRPMQHSLGLHRSSHHLGALVEANCPSFQSLYTQACARFLIRAKELLITHPSHPTSRTLVANRAAAANAHCRSYINSSIPLLTYAEQTVIPHLINNVLSRLPELAPHHPLIPRYFPGPLVHVPAPNNALPSTLTLDEINSLIMVDTHREWRDGPKSMRAGGESSTAPLLTIKTSPSLPPFLRLEQNPMVSIRALIRANRIHTQHRRYTRLNQHHIDPTCSHPSCRLSAPFFLDTIEHILLACPRHHIARQQLTTQLSHCNSIAPPSSTHINAVPPLSLALISGEMDDHYYNLHKHTNRQRTQHYITTLAFTATYIKQVMKDRLADKSLLPFHFSLSTHPDPP